MPRTSGSFRPGQSGNPSGRPAVVKEVQKLARAHTVEAIEALVGILRSKKSPAAARVAAANAILDRGYGKPPQSISAEDGGLVIKLLRFADTIEDEAPDKDAVPAHVN